MPKLAAGILLFRRSTKIEVLLVHPGSPFWAKKDAGAWSLPKGEYQDTEDATAAAKREFKEETGHAMPEGKWLSLGNVKYGNKKVTAWAVEGHIDATRVKSNLFEMEWPPKSGKMQLFPEVDRAGWFSLGTARKKIVKGQADFIDRLAVLMGNTIQSEDADEPQLSLFN